jgi:hypothetical protein
LLPVFSVWLLRTTMRENKKNIEEEKENAS